jgi:hypothetical protein
MAMSEFVYLGLFGLSRSVKRLLLSLTAAAECPRSGRTTVFYSKQLNFAQEDKQDRSRGSRGVDPGRRRRRRRRMRSGDLAILGGEATTCPFMA